MTTFLLILSFAFLGAMFYFFYKLIKKNDSVGKNLLLALVCLALGGICVRSAIEIDESRKDSYYNSECSDYDSGSSRSNNTTFKAHGDGPCSKCDCPGFIPQPHHPATCDRPGCEHSKDAHYYENHK